MLKAKVKPRPALTAVVLDTLLENARKARARASPLDCRVRILGVPFAASGREGTLQTLPLELVSVAAVSIM